MYKHKYRARKSVCLAGHNHDSVLEAEYCKLLYLQTKAKLIKGYEIQKTFNLIVNDKLICKHIVDFWVAPKKGNYEIHEAKGYPTPVWKLKHKLFLALFPEIIYKVIGEEKREVRKCRNKKLLK